jgi:uncharacterized protein YjbI with pentapeptide repeats
VELGGARWS